MKRLCCEIRLWWLQKEVDHLCGQVQDMERERAYLGEYIEEAQGLKAEYERRIIAARSVC